MGGVVTMDKKVCIHIFLLCVAAIFIHSAVHGQENDVNELFDGSVLGSEWYWIREDPAKWSLTANPGYLRIITQRKDIWQHHNSAPIVLRPAGFPQYEIRTFVSITPTANYHQAGLVMYGDDNNYVRLTYGWINHPTFEFGAESGGVFRSKQITAPVHYNNIHLRIVKIGASYLAFYSSDGAEWVYIGTHYNVPISPSAAGLTAFNAEYETGVEIPADFDTFQLLSGVEYRFNYIPMMTTQ